MPIFLYLQFWLSALWVKSLIVFFRLSVWNDPLEPYRQVIPVALTAFKVNPRRFTCLNMWPKPKLWFQGKQTVVKGAGEGTGGGWRPASGRVEEEVIGGPSVEAGER